jgi:effector-binding domain-containing protein
MTSRDVTITVQTVPPRTLAAVRRRVTIGAVGAAWKPALDQVWAFLRAHPGLRTDGHNVFVYHHPASRDAPMDVDFGVEVTRPFDGEGEVVPAEAPAGEVAMAVHVGPYDQLRRTHDAIHAWHAETGRAFAGTSWEIYGDWSDDPSKLETTVCYLLGTPALRG